MTLETQGSDSHAREQNLLQHQPMVWLTFGELGRNIKFCLLFFPYYFPSPLCFLTLVVWKRNFLSQYNLLFLSLRAKSLLWQNDGVTPKPAVPTGSAEQGYEPGDRQSRAMGLAHNTPFCFFRNLHHEATWGLWVKNGREERALSIFFIRFCVLFILKLEKRSEREKWGKSMKSMSRKTMADEHKKPKLNNVEQISNICKKEN